MQPPRILSDSRTIHPSRSRSRQRLEAVLIRTLDEVNAPFIPRMLRTCQLPRCHRAIPLLRTQGARARRLIAPFALVILMRARMQRVRRIRSFACRCRRSVCVQAAESGLRSVGGAMGEQLVSCRSWPDQGCRGWRSRSRSRHPRSCLISLSFKPCAPRAGLFVLPWKTKRDDSKTESSLRHHALSNATSHTSRDNSRHI